MKVRCRLPLSATGSSHGFAYVSRMFHICFARFRGCFASVSRCFANVNPCDEPVALRGQAGHILLPDFAFLMKASMPDTALTIHNEF